LVGAARLLPGMPPPVPSKTTKIALLQAFQKTGATGLEPATSGVTGRNGEENVSTRGKQSQVSCAVSPPQSAIRFRRMLGATCQTLTKT
jgi:hypothetical protein